MILLDATFKECKLKKKSNSGIVLPVAEMDSVKGYFSLASTEHSFFSSDKIWHPSSSGAEKRKRILITTKKENYKNIERKKKNKRKNWEEKIRKPQKTGGKRKNTKQNPPGFFLLEVSKDHELQIGKIKMLHQDKSEINCQFHTNIFNLFCDKTATKQTANWSNQTITNFSLNLNIFKKIFTKA